MRTQQNNHAMLAKNTHKIERNAFDGLAKFYKKCSKANIEMGDSGQTLDQFLEMKGIEPNQEGTGRISFSDVKKIECLRIRVKNKNRSFDGQVCQIIETFFNIPTHFLDSQLQIQKSGIKDQHRGLQYSLKRNKTRFDALQLLDLLTEYKSQSALLIAFIDSGLHEQGGDVYGRACGNGVAVIDFSIAGGTQQEKAKFYQTFLHQTLHTLGFDHCLAWTCMMNPLVAGDLWLCPCCLTKLHGELCVDIGQWMENLVKLFKKYVKWNKFLINKSQKILDCFIKDIKQ